VVADIGGNLKLESLQDTSHYDSKQQSLGGSISVGVGVVSGSLSASKSKINSDYASVTEQTGLKSGDGGFQVKVQGNTDLKGAVISSSEQAVNDNKNQFSTGGQLSLSDIQNKADYSGDSFGITLSGSNNKKESSLTPSGGGIGSDHGSASSTTRSGISGIAGNVSARTGDA
jgi:filamentous hemagglutinin